MASGMASRFVVRGVTLFFERLLGAWHWVSDLIIEKPADLDKSEELKNPNKLRLAFREEPATVLNKFLDLSDTDPVLIRDALTNLAENWKSYPGKYLLPPDSDFRKTKWSEALQVVLTKIDTSLWAACKTFEREGHSFTELAIKLMGGTSPLELLEDPSWVDFLDAFLDALPTGNSTVSRFAQKARALLNQWQPADCDEPESLQDLDRLNLAFAQNPKKALTALSKYYTLNFFKKEGEALLVSPSESRKEGWEEGFKKLDPEGALKEICPSNFVEGVDEAHLESLYMHKAEGEENYTLERFPELEIFVEKAMASLEPQGPLVIDEYPNWDEEPSQLQRAFQLDPLAVMQKFLDLFDEEPEFLRDALFNLREDWEKCPRKYLLPRNTELRQKKWIQVFDALMTKIDPSGVFWAVCLDVIYKEEKPDPLPTFGIYVREEKALLSLFTTAEGIQRLKRILNYLAIHKTGRENTLESLPEIDRFIGKLLSILGDKEKVVQFHEIMREALVPKKAVSE